LDDGIIPRMCHFCFVFHSIYPKKNIKSFVTEEFLSMLMRLKLLL
jgi:hypothetical protein